MVCPITQGDHNNARAEGSRGSVVADEEATVLAIFQTTTEFVGRCPDHLRAHQST